MGKCLVSAAGSQSTKNIFKVAVEIFEAKNVLKPQCLCKEESFKLLLAPIGKLEYPINQRLTTKRK